MYLKAYRLFPIKCISRYKICRGALDFGGVVGRSTARSRYG